MIGTRAGKYRITERLGRGSMGTVYRAVDDTLQREVAIKVLNAEVSEPEARQRFKAEAVAIARLNHPRIAKIYELFEHDGQWLMAMEFLQGQTLEQLVNQEGPLKIDRAVELVAQALSALSHAHGMGVVHRDLKPANLMARGAQLTVMDFGIARIAGSEHLTSAGLRMGTPAYMAPEQVMGEEVDTRADIFAMGCVLYHLVTASLPFKGETPLAMVQSRLKNPPTPVRMERPDLPEWLERVLGRALARNPGDRFQSADEFREALRQGMAGQDLGFSTPPPPQPAYLMETMLPGTVPVTAGTERPAGASTPVAAPAPSQPAEPPADPAAPVTRARFPLMLVAAAATVVGVAAIVYVWSNRGASTPPADAPASSPVVVAPPPSAAPTPAPSPVASPAPTTPAPAGTPAATPGATTTPSPTAKPADAPLRFEGARRLRVTESNNSSDADVSVFLRDGLVGVETREGGRESWTYRAVRAVTFIRDKRPASAPGLSAPPVDLRLPGGIPLTGDRFVPDRNWITLQGQGWFLLLSVRDQDVEPLLTALGERTRARIERRHPTK